MVIISCLYTTYNSAVNEFLETVGRIRYITNFLSSVFYQGVIEVDFTKFFITRSELSQRCRPFVDLFFYIFLFIYVGKPTPSYLPVCEGLHRNSVC